MSTSSSKPSPATRMLFRGSSSTLSAPEVNSVAVTAITAQPHDSASPESPPSSSSRSRTESVTSTPSSFLSKKGKSPLSLLSSSRTPSISGPSTSTTTTIIGSNHPPPVLSQPPSSQSQSQSQSQSHPFPPPSTIPSRQTPHPLPQPPDPKAIDQARTAVLATLSNHFDREITPRAALLHQNNAAIERQQADLVRATHGLKRENDKLAKMADTYGKKVKEVGMVQNWAEMLELEFLRLEETMRRVREGETGSEEGGSWTGSEGGSWVGSEGGWEGRERDRERGGGVRPEDVPLPEPETGEGGL
ncbi:hypothetical protein QBC41DRAFT_345841 [Cercophora samala]|uniref:Biogenesis of lysosome-related organelles complex 1 subunit 1 n=1 Tax=Cercophora samala TaxID=330535 RepID=A0AA39ZFE0_9PEZI|nr:hypothetical protein QBC41DRAFT_345841 [Cercophora samala]